MRLSSATLLLGSTSVLSALVNVASAAPVLIRISLIENDIKAVHERDDFFRYVRVGAAAVPAGNNYASDAAAPEDEIDDDDADDEDLDGGLVPSTADSSDNRTPMRPELEFTPAHLQPPELQCNGNIWERMVGRINDFFVDMLGLSDGSHRRNQCIAQSVPQSVQKPPIYAPPSTASTTEFDSSTSTTATTSMPYHRNGAPLGSPRFRAWGNGRGWRHRPSTFTQRVQRALYALSPWEGRAVAFVMGCGLGVMLRMLFVFVVLGARFLSKRNSQFAVALCGVPEEEYEEDDEEEKQNAIRVLLGDEEFEGVVLFDAGSLKGASVEDLPLWEEKQYQ